MAKFCDVQYDGLGMECQRCGSWRRGFTKPECPPYITRMEPDGKRLPHIKTREQNRQAWVTWQDEEYYEHPRPADLAQTT